MAQAEDRWATVGVIKVMDWLDFVQQIIGDGGLGLDAAGMGESCDGVHVIYDEHGVTVLSDVNGDGVVDQASRMEYSGTSCTIDLSEWGAVTEGSAPERGIGSGGRRLQSPGWGVAEWG